MASIAVHVDRSLRSCKNLGPRANGLRLVAVLMSNFPQVANLSSFHFVFVQQ